MITRQCCPTRLILIISILVADVICFGISSTCLLDLWFLTLASIISTDDLCMYTYIYTYIVYSTNCFFLTHNFFSILLAIASFYIYFHVCALSFRFLHHQKFVKQWKFENLMDFNATIFILDLCLLPSQCNWP